MLSKYYQHVKNSMKPRMSGICLFNRKSYNSRKLLVPLRDPGKDERTARKSQWILHLPYLLPCDSYWWEDMKAEGYQNKPFMSNAWKENNISHHNNNCCSTSESTSKYDEVLRRVKLSIGAIAGSGFQSIKNPDFSVLVFLPSIWVIIVIRKSLSQEDYIDKW